jgi:integrase/recombinase XerD
MESLMSVINVIEDEFKHYLKEKNYTVQTSKQTMVVMAVFDSYLKKTKRTLSDLYKSEVYTHFINYRGSYLNKHDKQNTARTVNNEIACLKRFTTFLYQRDFTEVNIGDQFNYCQLPKLVLPKDILTKRELIKVLKTPKITTLEGYRDRTCFELLYATGIRANELCHLELKDINEKEQSLFIQKGKFQKDRVVPINGIALHFLMNYIQTIRPILMKIRIDKNRLSHNRVFVSNVGTSLTSTTLYDHLKPHLKKAKLKKRIAIHSFRHTVATHLIQNGMPLRYVQELLGHDTQNATLRYVNLCISDLQKDYERCLKKE